MSPGLIEFVPLAGVAGDLHCLARLQVVWLDLAQAPVVAWAGIVEDHARVALID